MASIPVIDPKQFDYSLNPGRIARYPLKERDQSMLLVYHKGDVSQRKFAEIGEMLDQGDLMVVNNTRVIRARLFFFKPSGARIEIFCLEPHEPPDYDRVFRQTGSVIWKCLVGNARKWKQEPLTGNVVISGAPLVLMAEKMDTMEGEALIRFSWEHPAITFGEILDAAGQVPLPPYLNREAEASDVLTYQTLFARFEGSVAAPTAGLHFSDALIHELQKKVEVEEITLHVGAGTFKPIKSDNIREHVMHTEHFELTRRAIQSLLEAQRRLIAVGTTTVRTLESLVLLAEKIHAGEQEPDAGWHLGQWDAYQYPSRLTRTQALETILEYMNKNGLATFRATTQLMIVPGYSFCMTDAMVTNFHMPRSSLLMLVAAYIGEDWKKVYDYALTHHFRFLSYGDGSILLP